MPASKPGDLEWETECENRGLCQQGDGGGVVPTDSTHHQQASVMQGLPCSHEDPSRGQVGTLVLRKVESMQQTPAWDYKQAPQLYRSAVEPDLSPLQKATPTPLVA